MGVNNAEADLIISSLANRQLWRNNWFCSLEFQLLRLHPSFIFPPSLCSQHHFSAERFCQGINTFPETYLHIHKVAKELEWKWLQSQSVSVADASPGLGSFRDIFLCCCLTINRSFEMSRSRVNFNFLMLFGERAVSTCSSFVCFLSLNETATDLKRHMLWVLLA